MRQSCARNRPKAEPPASPAPSHAARSSEAAFLFSAFRARSRGVGTPSGGRLLSDTLTAPNFNPDQQKAQAAKIPGSVEDIDKVPESLRPFYELDPKSGRHVARVEGHYVPASKLVEFRENNIEASRRLAEAEAAMATYRAIGEDPKALEEEVSRLRKIEQKLSDNELVDKKGWETALAQRTDQMKQSLEGQIIALKEQVGNFQKERDAAVAENKRIVVSGEITRAAIAAGVLPDAIPDLLSRAERSGWTRSDKGEVILFDERTNSYVYGANGVDYITPEEWVLSLKQSARHFFNMPFGGGAIGGDQFVAGKNPWSKDGWDDMAQAAAYRSDPVKAEQLAKAAGSRIGALRPA
jgi:hypothetical protein